MPNQGLSLGVDLPGQVMPGEAKRAALYQALLNMGAMLMQHTPYKQSPLASIVQGLAGGVGSYNNMLGGYQQQLLQDQLRQIKVRELESQIGLQGAQAEEAKARAEKLRRPDLDEELKADYLRERIEEKKRQAIDAQKAQDASAIQSVIVGLSDEEKQKLAPDVNYLEGLISEHPATYTSYRQNVKREAPKIEMLTIYGPRNATMRVPSEVGKPYTPPPGFSLEPPEKTPKPTRDTASERFEQLVTEAFKIEHGGRSPNPKELLDEITRYKKQTNPLEALLKIFGGSEGAPNAGGGEFVYDPKTGKMVRK